MPHLSFIYIADPLRQPQQQRAKKTGNIIANIDKPARLSDTSHAIELTWPETSELPFISRIISLNSKMFVLFFYMVSLLTRVVLLKRSPEPK